MKYLCDVRVGCIGVYPEPKENCLALPMNFFTYYQHGKYVKGGNWGGKHWIVPTWRVWEARAVCWLLNHPSLFLQRAGKVYAWLHMFLRYGKRGIQ